MEQEADVMETSNYDPNTSGEVSGDLGTETAGTESDGVKQSDFDPQQWGYKFRGETLYPKDRNHIVTLMQQGHLASQRIAEVNKRALELDQQAKSYEQYKKLEEAFQSNPAFQKKIMEMWQRAQMGEDVLTDENGKPAIPPQLMEKISKIDEIEAKFSELTAKEQDQALQSEINELKQKYPDNDWDSDDGDGTLTRRVLQTALDKGLDNLEDAYRLLSWDKMRTNTEAETLRKAKENRIAERKAGVIDKGGASERPAPKSVSVRDLNWNQIAEAALKDIR